MYAEFTIPAASPACGRPHRVSTCSGMHLFRMYLGIRQPAHTVPGVVVPSIVISSNQKRQVLVRQLLTAQLVLSGSRALL